MKALEWSHYTAIFYTLNAANSVVGGQVWLKIKLIKAFMVFLVTCRNERVHLKMKMLEWSQQICHCKYMRISQDPHGQLTPQSKVGSA